MPELNDNGAPASDANYTLAMASATVIGQAHDTAVTGMRTMLDSLLRANVLDNYHLEPMIDAAKGKAGYAVRDTKWQATFRKSVQDLRTVAGRYAGLPEDIRIKFAERKMLFPALLSDIKARIKVEDDAAKVEAERVAAEAEAERLKAAGFDTPEAEEATIAAQDSDRMAELHVEAIVALIGKADRTERENAALTALIDAVTAYTAVTLDQAANG